MRPVRLTWTIGGVALAADGSELARGTLAVTWTGTDLPNGPGCPNRSTSDRVFLEVG